MSESREELMRVVTDSSADEDERITPGSPRVENVAFFVAGVLFAAFVLYSLAG